MSGWNEGSAGFKVTGIVDSAGTTLNGPMGITLQRIVEDVPINAGENVTPVARPPRSIDARVVTRSLGLSSPADIYATPASVTADIECADGTTVSTVEVGPCQPRNFDFTAGHAEQAHVCEGEHRMVGSEMTFSISA